MKSDAWIVPALLLAAVVQAAAQTPPVIEVKPGDNVAKIVARAQEDATFHLDPGIYRLQYARGRTTATVSQ
jgi:hypothetical protein